MNTLSSGLLRSCNSESARRNTGPYLSRLVAGSPPRRPGFEPRSGHVGLVVDKVALGQVFSEYFDFPCQFSFHRLLHIHHHIIGQWMADIQSGLSLAPPQETKKKKKNTHTHTHTEPTFSGSRIKPSKKPAKASGEMNLTVLNPRRRTFLYLIDLQISCVKGGRTSV
jgi:hypothetical protein